MNTGRQLNRIARDRQAKRFLRRAHRRHNAKLRRRQGGNS